MNPKFKFGDRVEVLGSGFYRGEAGTVISYGWSWRPIGYTYVVLGDRGWRSFVRAGELKAKEVKLVSAPSGGVKEVI